MLADPNGKKDRVVDKMSVAGAAGSTPPNQDGDGGSKPTATLQFSTQSVLYMLTFASGKSYIGISKTFVNRMIRHRKDAKKADLVVYRAWRKLGAPTVRVLAYARGPYLLELEKQAVASYRTFKDGYNMTPGGEIPYFSEETRAKTSTRMKGQHYRLGIPHNEETLAKMRGRKRSPEGRARMAAAQTRRYHGPVYSPPPPLPKRQRGDALRGRPRPEEVKKKIRDGVLRSWATRVGPARKWKWSKRK